ncbi:hypothetical protein CVT24_009154 [Panaeolus cyanescens]|uniref:Uncharacterized protein n=1 Tax=Panaeolus cyanescens TaxID=181874 RepID=A0A409Y8G5_9AGAR|nr:hypothetical protein CVT24_009154 [Panaeolus cyanescens]
MSVADRLQVIVQSTSSEIHYEGDWEASVNDRTISGNVMTVPEGKQGSLLYELSGTSNARAHGILRDFDRDTYESFKLYCEINPHETATRIAMLDSIGSFWTSDPSFTFLCEVDNLNPSSNYTLSITLQSLGSPAVWFDSVLFDPAPTRSLDNDRILMDHRHLMIQYDSGWTLDFGNSAHLTNSTGSTMKLDFNGTSLKWYTINYSRFSNATQNSEARWKVDDLEPQPFVVPAPSTNDTGTYQHLLFEVSGLSPGLHHLEVTHQGDESTWPLTLSNLIIQNALPDPNLPPTSTDIQQPTLNPTTNTHDSQSGSDLSAGEKAAIAVSTCLVVLTLCGALFYIWRRRSLGSTAKLEKDSEHQNDADNSTQTSPPVSISARPPSLPLLSIAHSSSKGTPVMIHDQTTASTSVYDYPHEPVSSCPSSKHGAPVTLQRIYQSDIDAPPPYVGRSPSEIDASSNVEPSR